MSLPVIMKQGLVSIYHVRQVGLNNLQAPSNYNFGVINDSWYNDAYPPFIGTSVMFDGENAINFVYNGTKYSVVQEDKIILIEKVSP